MTAPRVLLLAATLLGPAAQTPPPAGEKAAADGAADLVNALLGGLLGGTEVTAAQLQREVAEAGGLPFLRDVPIAFLSRDALAAYLRELLDAEYPVAQARADARLLEAFDLLPPGTDLRALRARVLEDNVAGFYDERPGRRQLYAVSGDRSFTPMNQIVLAHELRHAQQDQYEDLHVALEDDVSDFDDRRIAWMSLLEGDATLVMERFVRLRLGGLVAAEEETDEDAGAAALSAAGLIDLPGAPPVVRDHLLQPYLAGLAFARALWARGGAEAMREAWRQPPQSTEQVLHPSKFFAREAPRRVEPPVAAPAGARLLSEGVLGELLLRTLVEEGAQEAAAGWGGDGWRLWDVGGRTALAWRSQWDRPADASEFHEALRARFARRGPPSSWTGWEIFAADGGRSFAVRRTGDAVDLVSADDPALLDRLLGRPARPAA
jgi:hypothetical protein